MPGMVRISFGMYNTTDDVDALVDALGKIARGDCRGVYRQDQKSGAFSAQDRAPALAAYFRLPDTVDRAIRAPRCD